jgi:hypothetical protein
MSNCREGFCSLKLFTERIRLLSAPSSAGEMLYSINFSEIRLGAD